jgi:hypothetical protein
MALAFLRDRLGNSPAREEWERLWATGAAPNLTRLLIYLSNVETFGSAQNNPTLLKALQIKDDLYWFTAGDIGVLFSYDGTDLVIIELTRFVDESEGKKQALAVAEQRI